MAQSERSGNGKARPIIIRREESSGGGHHGGAWKVAYADFVTAMMAFFLVMWLINATTEDQRKGLADYFSPTTLMSHNSSGTGKPFGGKTAFENGAMVSDRGAVQITQGLHPVLSNPAPQRHPPNPHAPRGGGAQNGAGDTPGPLPSAGAAGQFHVGDAPVGLQLGQDPAIDRVQNLDLGGQGFHLRAAPGRGRFLECRRVAKGRTIVAPPPGRKPGADTAPGNRRAPGRD